MASLFRLTACASVATALLATQAHAISRVNTTAKSCQAIQSQVAREGAVILRYPAKRTAGLTLYDRYVRNSGFCASGETATPAWVPARDTARCPVLNCKTYDRDDDLLLWPWKRRHR